MNTNQANPTACHVAIALCLASVAFGLLLYVIEYLIGKELSSTGLLSTIIPAMSIGHYFGHKSGVLMPSKTRWSAIFLWVLVSIVVFIVASIVLDISLYEVFGELGWFNLLIAIFLVITLIAAYFLFKWGEKLGIKTLERAQSKI
jgi:hypothetical protein